MKKSLSVFLCLAMLLTLPLAAHAATFTAGTYTGNGTGNNGPLSVTVTVSADHIDAVVVGENTETQGIADMALKQIPEDIVTYQSLAVDAISGATNTSKAIVAAVVEALTAAGGDVSTLYTPIEKEVAVAGDLIRKDVDVVVVGAGGAGLAAAVTVVENGGSVLVIDKMPVTGGNTMRAGSTYNAADPERQHKITMTASLDEVYASVAREPKNELHKSLQEQVSKQLEAYVASGETYVFDSPEWHALNTYDGGDQVGDLSLIYNMTQNACAGRYWLPTFGGKWSEKVFLTIGGLWPRSMDAASIGAQGSIGGNAGNMYIKPLQAFVTDAGNEVMVNTKATDMIVEDGRIIGVKAEDTTNGQRYDLYGKKGVILATGGFGANAEMVEQYSGSKVTRTTNHAGATGDGILLAQSVGAELVGMQYVQTFPLANPQTGALKIHYSGSVTDSIYVNREGKRFVCEQGRRDEICNGTLAQTDGMMFSIYDQRSAVADIDQYIEMGEVFCGKTLAELAEKIGVDTLGLEATVANYNEMVIAGKDTEQNKKQIGLTIEEGPFYGVPYAPSVHHTMGGVKIDVEARVLNKANQWIEGLFACGEVTGGIHGSNRVGANALPDCVVYGRIAGANAIK